MFLMVINVKHAMKFSQVVRPANKQINQVMLSNKRLDSILIYPLDKENT